MKKFIISAIAAAALMIFPAYASGLYSLEGGLDGLSAVTSSLADGGAISYTEGFVGLGAELDGSSGLYLGRVDGDFTVSAMIKMTSSGGTKNVFFKNMGSASAEKWTGVIFDNGTPALWANGGGFSWTRLVTANENVLGSWAYITYTEAGGVGSLYVNGVLAGSADIVSDGGELYAAATYWSADAPTGAIDEIFFDSSAALSADEIAQMYTDLAVKNITLPSETISDLELPSFIGNAVLSWKSDNEDVITSDGKVTRGSEDCTVNLTLYIDGVENKTFSVTVLKKPVPVNENLVLSYTSDSFADGVAVDNSGNGNHGTIYGGMTGGHFDGVDDYVQMPEGLLADLDEFTIIMRLKPEIANAHQFTFCFGNSSSEGYFFLNTSRPGTNTLRLALTKTGSGSETDIRSIPGIRRGEEANIAITVSSSEAAMYVNGIPVASGDLGFSPKELGSTKANWLAKSPYSPDPYFSGDIYEFSIYPYKMSDADISAMHSVPETDASYISDFNLGESALIVNLNRDCMVSAVFFDKDGNTLEATTKKVSDDDLTASFNCNGAASAEITAFDAATGIIKDRRAVTAYDGLVAYTSDGGNVKVVNTTNKTINAVVIAAMYGSSGLEKLDATTVTVEADSFEVVPVSLDGGKLMVWSSLSEMRPIAEQ